MPSCVSHPTDVPLLAGVTPRYYGWVIREPSARAQENARLLARIRVLPAAYDGVVGSPRACGKTCATPGSDVAVIGWLA